MMTKPTLMLITILTTLAYLGLAIFSGQSLCLAAGSAD
jgi:hypothetical protein